MVKYNKKLKFLLYIINNNNNNNNNINNIMVNINIITPPGGNIDPNMLGQCEWGQFIDLETDYISINNYTFNEDFSYKKKNNTYSNSVSNDYYGNSRFNIISVTLNILNFFEQLINYANRI